MPDFKEFNASIVPLAGSNLIEASAGTGKTYSIAVLSLRLILENEIPIKEILMVTFTKAAVAELEERIRLFIRQAYKVSRGEDITDTTITGLVQTAINRAGLEKAQALLQEAVLFLDETSVLTIHSFCQQTLNEFAFETGQLFGAELVQDTSAMLQDEMNKFWRRHVTVIPVDLLRHLQLSGLSRESIGMIVKEHLTGKRYYNYNASTDYTCCEEEHLALLEELKVIEVEESGLREALLDHVVVEMEDITKSGNSNAYCRKNLVQQLENPVKFLDLLWSKRDKVNVIKVYPALLERLEICHEAVERRRDKIKELIRKLNCLAINEVSKGIDFHKSANNQMSYDDLIQNLHKALVTRENVELVACLRTKYKAVFIDEFQDTDRMQYEIFQKAYGQNTILFYIGDPKQSIYAWRKADIFTYFKAQEQVEHLYSMNNNYRSSESYIEAMNLFFKPHEDFDTFHFQQAESAIEYIHVDSPVPNGKGELCYENQADVPMSIITAAKKDDLCEAVTAQVVELLSSNAYTIKKDHGQRSVRPADIGILVRGNKEGQLIKRQLSKFGIPAVTIGEAKVLQSDESSYLLYVLQAMNDISMASINKALLSPFTGFTDAEIRDMDEEHAIELFKKYKALWEKDGIYPALQAFVADYQVKQVLLYRNTASGERILTNLFQLIELLHKVQSTKKLVPLEVLSWLKRGMEGMENTGDEFEQRIESDEESIKIVTIHKSKGLEYNIVLAPFLDLMVTNKHSHCSYRDALTGEYVSLEKASLNAEQKEAYETQLEQENRRLVYVAVTRAVYKCFLFKNSTGRFNNSSLSVFLRALYQAPTQLIKFINEKLEVSSEYSYASPEIPLSRISAKPVRFELAQQNWQKMSYSMLKRRHDISLRSPAAVQEDKYDHFMFSQLLKGATTGNMLHNIFENIAFNHNGKWDYAIRNAVQRFAPLQSERYTEMLKMMLDQVLNASIDLGEDRFRLADVNTSKSIHELEFDFRVSPFQVNDLNRLGTEDMNIAVNEYRELEGVMNGKIDLFFEHGGKYFVLDWKSNHLGNTLSDYSSERLQNAMNENNYHLQYLLYTLAIKKYLKSRLSAFDYDTQFGGVIYLFVRGLRKDLPHGVFATKPQKQVIEKLEWLFSQPEMVETI
ncbi:exodeoxyribonuclease V subunit beta [Pedobacter sp. SAFR-022]|uniref:exodeoxyribonuclease V subunit beta n=1 Tax=Pedobacter sp. SAFR-022 TaxID=3436861 RepID=UPI003F7D645F